MGHYLTRNSDQNEADERKLFDPHNTYVGYERTFMRLFPYVEARLFQTPKRQAALKRDRPGGRSYIVMASSAGLSCMYVCMYVCRLYLRRVLQ